MDFSFMHPDTIIANFITILWRVTYHVQLGRY